ncbi:MAG: hypothetical protein JNK54_02590 [Elusimicrobia bacterium]|nr:hypothetical protein [Elusimicrobiota bacterium]
MRKYPPFGLRVFLAGLILGSHLSSIEVAAATVTPLTQMTLTTGQSFYDGTATSVSGNADVVVTPVVKFSDQWSVFPTYHGFYQGTQDVQSLAGGGRFFRDTTGHSLLLKDVHTFGVWKIKPSLGASMEWLRETRDEGWGQGLFDYRKWNGGLEVEYNPTPAFGGRAAYDYFQIIFPNYESLESAQDPTLSRELAGEKVLNNTNGMTLLNTWMSLPWKGKLDVTGLVHSRKFKDQPLVNDQGQLLSTNRKDESLVLDSVLTYPLPTLFGIRFWGDLGGRYITLNSNQNHFDAKQSVFQANYYDYEEGRGSAQLVATILENLWRMSLSGYYERRRYADRLAQDSTGVDLNENLITTTVTTRLGLAHSLTPNTKIHLNGSLGWSHSNTNYEGIFRYNYRIASYGIGISYDF